MASFDENGKYIKTDWKAGDKITATKLNKIEESIEAVNDNDISRHVEADARLDALEAKDSEHDKELTNVKNAIADNKAATDICVYDINSRMQFLEEEINDGIADIADMSTSINNTIASAEANLNAIVTDAETNLNDIIREAEENLNNGGGNIGPRLDALESSSTTLQTDVSSLETAVSSLQAELAANVSTLESNINDIRGVL
jgi:predicted  nucleic acid-binding Zn-ribbon protein